MGSPPATPVPRTGKTRKVSSQDIRDEEGSLLRDPELILGRWVRFFSGLLNGESDKLDHSIIAGIPQHPAAHVLGVEPTKEVMASALRSMANAKAVGPDELPVELYSGCTMTRPCSGSFTG